MYLYIMFAFLAISSYITIFSKKDYGLFSNIIFYVVLLVFLLQLTIGPDYFDYLWWYNNTDTTSLYLNFSNILNYMFNALINLNKIIGGNYLTFKFLVNLFILGFLFYTIKKNSDNILLSIFLFISSGIYVVYFCSGIRQMLAMAIFIYAYYELLSKNKYIKYTLMIILATLIHYSAIITILLIPIHIFLPKIRENYKIITASMAIISISILLMLSYSHEFIWEFHLSKGSWLTEWARYTTGFKLDIIGIILRSSLVIFNLLLYYAVPGKKRTANDFFFISSIIAAYFIYIAMSGFAVFGRIYDFVAVIEFVTVPNLLIRIDRIWIKRSLFVYIIMMNFAMLKGDINFTLGCPPYIWSNVEKIDYYTLIDFEKAQLDLEIYQ